MKKAEIIERINSIPTDQLTTAVDIIWTSKRLNAIRTNRAKVIQRYTGHGYEVMEIRFISRATKPNMEAVYYAILDEIARYYGLKSVHAIDPEYTPEWWVTENHATEATTEAVETTENQNTAADTEALTEAVKALVEEAASETGHSAADFASALREYHEIVKGIGQEYNGKATVAVIREEHPELNFMDDEDIEDIINLSLYYTTETQNTTNNTNTKEDNTMNTFTNDIKADIITRLENMEGSTYCLCDLGFELTMNENHNGSWYCSTFKAKEEIKNNFELFGSIAEEMRDNWEDTTNPLLEPERFHVGAMIYLYETVFNAAVSDFDEWNDEITIDDDFIERVREALEDVDVDRLF